MKAATAPRQTADARRVAVLDAATHEFGLRGLHGGSTETIARAAGISQPYLFRLFGSKKDLYLAASQRCIDELYVVFSKAAEGHSGVEALQAMGGAYTEIMQDHDRLMLMLKSWTSCDDPDIARMTRSAWRNLVDLAEQASGEPAVGGQPVLRRRHAHHDLHVAEPGRGPGAVGHPAAHRVPGRHDQLGRTAPYFFCQTFVSNDSLPQTLGAEMRNRTLWTFVITSVALFMVTLDNLVVTTAIPVIRTDLGASLESLEWTVNAYTLTFAVLLLTGAALGDRFGRRRMFSFGVGIFTAGSITAALAPSIGLLNLARAVQGLGGAIVLAADPHDPQRRRSCRTSAASRSARGAASAASPSHSARSWAAPSCRASPGSGSSGSTCRSASRSSRSACARLTESHGPAGKLDLGGLALSSAGLFGIVWGLVRGNTQGWASTEIVGALTAGAALLAAFVAWELRAQNPMLPMRFFRNRTFTLANAASMFMFFGMFGSIFLLSQFFQTVQGYSPLGSGLRILPWTLAPDVRRTDRRRACRTGSAARRSSALGSRCRPPGWPGSA